MITAVESLWFEFVVELNRSGLSQEPEPASDEIRNVRCSAAEIRKIPFWLAASHKQPVHARPCARELHRQPTSCRSTEQSAEHELQDE